ncbi:hypothetical protein BHM03_00011835 [Ensete ventricosum]|uniref:Uncharacterized protein n=1 Tax=Ensete ventricosum TaxID=4639 RepID=A0A445MDD8_ENSVE|nr:hypothetical protein BHM03_00011835 [Ensete ventricosum]
MTLGSHPQSYIPRLWQSPQRHFSAYLIRPSLNWDDTSYHPPQPPIDADNGSPSVGALVAKSPRQWSPGGFYTCEGGGCHTKSLLLLQYLAALSTASAGFLGPLMAPHAFSRIASRPPSVVLWADQHVRIPGYHCRGQGGIRRTSDLVAL